MSGNGERANWIYVIIGLGLVTTVGVGFYQLNHRAEEWERAMLRLAAQTQPESRDTVTSSESNAGNADRAATIVEAIETGFENAEKRALNRDRQLLEQLTDAVGARLATIEGQMAAARPDPEEMTGSILDQVLAVVEQRIEEQVQVSEHQEAKQTLAQTLIRTGLGGALEAYRRDVGRYPTDRDGGLSALIEPSSDEETMRYWDGPYVTTTVDLLDPWGHELYYDGAGDYSDVGYDLASAGPDKEFGTPDDIVNWKEGG